MSSLVFFAPRPGLTFTRFQADEADRLLAELDCSHRDALVTVMASCRLTGRRVPPSLPVTPNYATSTSQSPRAFDFVGGKYVPEAITVLPTLNAVLSTELKSHLAKILDPLLYTTPLIDLSREKWEYVHAFLQLIQPEEWVFCLSKPWVRSWRCALTLQQPRLLCYVAEWR